MNEFDLWRQTRPIVKRAINDYGRGNANVASAKRVADGLSRVLSSSPSAPLHPATERAVQEGWNVHARLDDDIAPKTIYGRFFKYFYPINLPLPKWMGIGFFGEFGDSRDHTLPGDRKF